MEQVRLGDPAGQAAQGRVLGGEELARGGLELVRASAYRDQSDRSIVITGIGIVITRIGPS